MTSLTPGLAKSRGGFDDTDYRIWAICRNRSALCRQNSPTRVLAPQARAQRQARSATRSVRRRLHVRSPPWKFAPQARAASAGGFTNHRSAWKVAPQATPATAPSWKVAPQASRAVAPPWKVAPQASP